MSTFGGTSLPQPHIPTEDHRKLGESRKPRRVIFYANGDRFFKGKKLSILTHRYFSLDDLLADVTKRLPNHLYLPNGVRQLYTTGGDARIHNIDQIADGQAYVCCGNEAFKSITYGKQEIEPWSKGASQRVSVSTLIGPPTKGRYLPTADLNSQYMAASIKTPIRRSRPGAYEPRTSVYQSSTGDHEPHPLSRRPGDLDPRRNIREPSNQINTKPKIVTVINSGQHPRQVIKLLLNRRSVQSLGQLLSDIGETFNPTNRGVKPEKIYAISGREVRKTNDFFKSDDIFIAAGQEEISTRELQELLQEVYPDQPYAPSIVRDWEKRRRTEKSRALRHAAGGVTFSSSTPQHVVEGASTEHALRTAVGDIETEKRDSGFEENDNTNEYASHHKENNQRRDQSDRRRAPIAPSYSTPSDSVDMASSRGSSSNWLNAARQEREKVRDRIQRRLEMDRRSLEEERRRRGLPATNRNIQLRRMQEHRHKETVGHSLARFDASDQKRQAEEQNLIQEAGVRNQNKKLPPLSGTKTHQEGSGGSIFVQPSNDQNQRPLSPLREETGGRGKAEGTKKARRRSRDVASDKNKVTLREIQVGQSIPQEPETQAPVNEETVTKDVSVNDPSPEKAAEGPENSLLTEVLPPVSENQKTTPAKTHQLPLIKAVSPTKQKKPTPPSPKRTAKELRQVAGVQVIKEQYDLGKTLGDGNFAIVRQATHRSSGDQYAVKIIDKSKLKGRLAMVESEIGIMKMCKHHNIIALKEEFETREEIYLVLELVKGGDLFDAISQSVKFPEPTASMMVHDMASALFYLHSRNVVHRDLKPENLLVVRNKDNSMTLKLADFGLAMEVTKPLKTVCGTPTYVAPEILTEEGYGIEVDMWALGVISYILLCGFPPFRSQERKQTELFELIISGEFVFLSPYWDQISNSAKDLIRNLLVVDKASRYTCIDVLCHPWIITQANTRPIEGIMAAARIALKDNLVKQASEEKHKFGDQKAQLMLITGEPLTHSLA